MGEDGDEQDECEREARTVGQKAQVEAEDEQTQDVCNRCFFANALSGTPLFVLEGPALCTRGIDDGRERAALVAQSPARVTAAARSALALQAASRARTCKHPRKGLVARGTEGNSSN